MDHEINMPLGWMGLWLERLHPDLYTYSTVTYTVLSIAAMVLGFKSLFHLRRTQRELTADPPSRAAIMSASDNRMLKLNRGQFYIANIYLFLAMAIYCVDTYISFVAISEDVDDNPTVYDRAMILDLAIYTVGMLAIFTAVFLLFPMLQIMLAFKLLHRRNPSATLASSIPGARILTTNIGQLWSVLAFLLMAYWPTYENATIRILVVEAVLGSSIMWLQLSFGLIFKVEQLEQLEGQQLLGSREMIIGYGTQMFTRREQEGLPVYERVQQVEVADEKSGA